MSNQTETVIVQNNTPPHWAEYLEYIEKRNRSAEALEAINLQQVHDRYEALPWYQKMFANTTWEEWEILVQTPTFQPSLLDYYEWDVTIRGKQ